MNSFDVLNRVFDGTRDCVNFLATNKNANSLLQSSLCRKVHGARGLLGSGSFLYGSLGFNALLVVSLSHGLPIHLHLWTRILAWQSVSSQKRNLSEVSDFRNAK